MDSTYTNCMAVVSSSQDSGGSVDVRRCGAPLPCGLHGTSSGSPFGYPVGQSVAAKSLVERELNVRVAAHEAVEEWKRAVAKHGDNTPDGETTDINRLATLGEEFGEVCRALTYDRDHAGPLKKELIQVAAMALAWAARL